MFSECSLWALSVSNPFISQYQRGFRMMRIKTSTTLPQPETEKKRSSRKQINITICFFSLRHKSPGTEIIITKGLFLEILNAQEHWLNCNLSTYFLLIVLIILGFLYAWFLAYPARHEAHPIFPVLNKYLKLDARHLSNVTSPKTLKRKASKWSQERGTWCKVKSWLI